MKKQTNKRTTVFNAYNNAERLGCSRKKKKIQGDNLSFRAEEEPAVKNKWLKNKGGHKCPEPSMERSLLSPNAQESWWPQGGA